MIVWATIMNRDVLLKEYKKHEISEVPLLDRSDS